MLHSGCISIHSQKQNIESWKWVVGKLPLNGFVWTHGYFSFWSRNHSAMLLPMDIKNAKSPMYLEGPLHYNILLWECIFSLIWCCDLINLMSMFWSMCPGKLEVCKFWKQEATLRSVTMSGHVKYKRNSLACKMQEDSACNTPLPLFLI